MESKDFFWSWSYKDHRVRIILNEPTPDRWAIRVTFECMKTQACGCCPQLSDTDQLRFPCAKEALQAAERLAYGYIDRIEQRPSG